MTCAMRSSAALRKATPTPAPIEIIPTLTDISGNPLTEVTDYTVSLKRGDEVFSAVKEIGTRAKESDPFCDDGITKNPI